MPGWRRPTRRRHLVTLFGASDEPGGKTRLHVALPGGENLSSIYDYQLLAGREAGVSYRLGTLAGREQTLALAPDLVLLATGASPVPPGWIPEEYLELGFILVARTMARDMLTRRNVEPGRAVLFDQDHTEMTYALAELLSRCFTALSLVIPSERLASDVSLINRQGIYQRLHDRQVDIRTCAAPQSLDQLEAGVVELVNVYNGAFSHLEGVVSITYATSRAPDDELDPQLNAAGIGVIPIGDCRAPRSVLAATRQGYEVAMSL